MTTPDAGQGLSILLSFRAENVRSFRDEFELSFLATTLAERPAVRHVPWRLDGATVDVLPAACIFGANGSGKSNVLKAMDDMRTVVTRSFRSWSPSGGTHRKPFRLDPEKEDEPSKFGIDVIIDGIRHEYGFALDDKRIVDEWAYRYPNGKAARLFKRTGRRVQLGNSMGPKGSAVSSLVRDNSLFLSAAAAVEQPDLLPLYLWFQRNMTLAEADTRPARHIFTAKLISDPQMRKRVMALVKAADLGIVDVSRLEIEMHPAMRERLERVFNILTEDQEADLDLDSTTVDSVLEMMGLRLHHRSATGEVEFDVTDESLGTLVWLGLVGPIVDALASGSVLLADEIDASLHPALVAQIVRLFQDPETNPKRAQIVFNSHDTTLLGDASGRRLLGRDQVWFAEKDQDGASRLYPLSELDVRKEEAVGRRYLAGRYGATPIISAADFNAAADLIYAGDER